MNVASLSLSKELYELSGWDDTEEWHKVRRTQAIGTSVHSEVIGETPAYDCGYLLRKLPHTAAILHTSSKYEWEAYFLSTELGIKAQRHYANTPEDALCKLCISLIKSGVLS